MKLNKNGTILIASLWILAILSILAIGIAFRISLEMRLNRYYIDRLKALYLAKAGFVKAQELLSKDKNIYDSIYECGVALSGETNPEDIFMNIKLGEGAFSIVYKEEGLNYPGISDEERRVNINTASKEVLEKLPGITAEAASSIIDWRDKDDTTLPNGAENSYYQTLEHPYICKNGDFSAQEELLLVKGVNLSIFDSIKDYITVYGDGKFNVNTAPRPVLIAFGMTDALADRIIEFRNGPDGRSGTKDDNIFLDTDIELALPGLSLEEAAIIGNLKNSFTIKSNYFKIESTGTTLKSKVERKAACIVKRDSGGCPKLISYREQ